MYLLFYSSEIEGMSKDAIVNSLDQEVANRISPAMKRKLARQIEAETVYIDFNSLHPQWTSFCFEARGKTPRFSIFSLVGAIALVLFSIERNTILF